MRSLDCLDYPGTCSTLLISPNIATTLTIQHESFFHNLAHVFSGYIFLASKKYFFLLSFSFFIEFFAWVKGRGRGL